LQRVRERFALHNTRRLLKARRRHAFKDKGATAQVRPCWINSAGDESDGELEAEDASRLELEKGAIKVFDFRVHRYPLDPTITRAAVAG
jgi:hypothetical protein